MEIKKSLRIDGLGLFATKSYKANSIIFILEGEIFDEPSRETIHVGNNKHIYDKYGIYINHSFEPNICINGFQVMALIDISNGDELVFNYNDTEINMANPFYVGEMLVQGKNK